MSGSLKPTAGNWYDYKMKLDKNANTYEVEISDGENTASGNGNISKSHAFDGLMFGAAMHAYMDDIVIKKYRGAPEVSVAELLDEDGNVQEYADPSTAAIRLVFTEEMDGESLADTVILSGAAAGERILSSDGCEYIIKIDDILKPDTELLLEVTDEAVSAGGIKIKAPYSMKIKVSDPDILLNIDYEDNVPQIIMWDGTSTYDYLTENSGNKYMKIVTSYSGTGYKLKQEIPKDGGDYSISFDFMLPELTSSTTRYLCLNEALPSGNGSSDAAYNQFGLLKTENRKFCVNGEAADGLEAEKNVWYSYKIDFNRKTRQYSLKITQRDDEEAGAAVLMYLAAGAAGLPVFAGGASTMALVGPSAGFLIGFLPAAVVTSLLKGQARVDSPKHAALTAARYLLACAAGCIVLDYLLGFIVQSAITGVALPIVAVASMGFVIGDCIKAVAVSLVASGLAKLR